jgi:ech hydrogenase subunit A
MNLIFLLVLLPLGAALIAAMLPAGAARSLAIKGAALAVAAGCVWLAVERFRAAPEWFALEAGLAHGIDIALLAGGFALAALILWFCRGINRREWYIPVLVVVQTVLLALAEFAPGKPEVARPLGIDSFAVLMALIIGVVGGLIILHAVRYMDDYHHHEKDVPDRRRAFFAVLFIFLAAMFGIVFSNHLLWMFFCWEVTTVCSFWLISYPRTGEALRNGFRALGLNLLGGVFFAAALAWLALGPGLRTFELDQLVAAGQAAALLPAVLIGVAGLTKSAQLPFSSWLLGAMVAPTPVSALLHSSTMVKAGVFILVKLAPVYHGSAAGFLLALAGAVTFMVASLVAVTKSNAKLVLAWSTIANLGLIVMCAGLGTVVTLWAAILLILFHAVAKALLFLAVGTTEHQIGSRDIEDMEGMVYRSPMLAILMAVGILGMFLAPFGMLISKYTCFKAFLTADGVPGAGVLLTCILAFGSAPTLFFWSKWLGKIVSMPRTAPQALARPPGEESFALVALAVITGLSCALFPLVDWVFIQPYTHALVEGGLLPLMDDSTPRETVVVMSVMLGALFLLPLVFWLRPPRYSEVSGYLSGANVQGGSSYRGAMGAERTVVSRNYYLTTFLSERKLTLAGMLAAGAAIAGMLAGGLG